MDYDYIMYSDDDTEYGVIYGNNRIVFIKAGLGGDHFGDEDKYLIMAQGLHKNYGCSIIVASNPNDGKSHVERDRSIIEQYISANAITQPEFFFFGHSNGGIKGLELSYSGIPFTKMILTNMPLMINFHKTKRYISNIPKTSILMVYGEKDPSFSYIPFIEGKFDNVEVSVIANADHNFQSMLDKFVNLGEKLFIK